MTRTRKQVATTVVLGLITIVFGLFLTVDGIHWRAKLLVMAARGKVPDLTFVETVRMMRPRGQYYLRPLVEGVSAYQVIHNPHTTAADSAAGGQLFRDRCSLCHGEAAQGTAPRFRDAVFRRGAMDWGLYRTITRGIPSTAMRAQDVSDRQAWQLITYIRSIARRPGEATGGDDPAGSGEMLSRLRLVDSTRLLQARRTPGDWLMYSGGYDGWRYSALQQINASNVADLRVRWVLQMPGAEKVETSPVVVDGIMFVTEPPAGVMAVDARTGTVLWSYRRQLPEGLRVCCGQVNRGVAVAGGLIYVATLDAHLVALDIRTGAPVWDTRLAAWDAGYSATGVPLVIGSRVIIGIAGGEYGTRGFIDAYDALTGRQLWRFNSVPGPGEAGHETWGGDSWMTGGSSTWLTGSYDPALGLIYWGVGNPAPNFDAESRPGRNLYSNSVVALDVSTGHLRWYYQFTPHDDHDWDSLQIPVLVDGLWQGRRRRLMLWANRNGFYYVLDRATGQFLLAKPFVKQTWAEKIDSAGVPVRRPNISPTAAGTLVYPSLLGGTNWWSPAYNPGTGYFYVPVHERGGIYYRSATAEGYNPGELFVEGTHENVPQERGWTAIRAIRAESGETAWDHRFDSRLSLLQINGVMTTAGGLVFGSDDANLVALSAASGTELWRFNTGGPIWASPVAYQTGGSQMIAIAAGGSLIAFGLK